MKELVLCRHAKSSWKYDIEDLYRPLNKRGVHAAPEMAQRWSGDPPDLILCSPAVRAYATALAYVHENKWPLSLISLREDLFEADVEEMLRLLSKLGECDRVWVFGHNPGINLLTEFLTGESIDNIVTCARATIQLNIIQWREILERGGKLIEITRPGK